MPPRPLLFACLTGISILAGTARGESPPLSGGIPGKPAAPAAGQVTIELELLAAPMVPAAEALYAGRGDAGADPALREKLLAGGATTILRTSVTGAAGTPLEENKLETKYEPLIYVYSSKWQEQGSDLQEGKEPSPLTWDDYDTKSETHETGHLLLVKTTPAEGGVLSEINFRWLGTPLIRPVNSWPVKGAEPHITQDRQWEINTRQLLAADRTILLAAAPEPAQAEGKSTGRMFFAFVRTGIGPHVLLEKKKPRKVDPDDVEMPPEENRTLQLWTLEMPEAVAFDWIESRTATAGDESQFARWLTGLGNAAAADAPALISLEVLQDTSELTENAFVASALQWLEPRGFEPADTRWVPFVPVPNESRTEAVAHRLETKNTGEAVLTLPFGTLKRTRWHGSTRGVRDEPVGVESFLTGDSAGTFYPEGPSGVVRLVSAQPHEGKMRLSFLRLFGPDTGRRPRSECTFALVETPAEPWLTRLTAGEDPSRMIPELRESFRKGRARVLHGEVATCGSGWRWTREVTRPWLSFVTYLNPSIHDGKFCFNPRFVYPGVPAGKFEINDQGMELTFCGRPADHHLGLWLTKQSDYTAQNSGVPVPEWPHFSANTSQLPPERPTVVTVGLGTSWSNPAERVLHWLVVRRIHFGADLQPNSPAPLQTRSWTLRGSDGGVLEYVNLLGTQWSYQDGRLLHTILPEKFYGAYAFKEKSPADPAEKLGSPQIEEALDGVSLTMDQKGWNLLRTTEPVKKVTESVTGYTEQPVGAAYGPAEPVAVSCERFIISREELRGQWPASGASLQQDLQGGRKLTVTIR